MNYRNARKTRCFSYGDISAGTFRSFPLWRYVFSPYSGYQAYVQRSCLKYRLYPTRAQERRLEQTLETCRRVYNSLLNWHKHDYEVLGKTVSRYQMNILATVSEVRVEVVGL